jgi:hypothetical protein
MTLPLETLMVVMLVIFVGYTIFGATGFGASPLTIPVLAQVLPLPFVLSLAALLDLSSGLALSFHTRRQADTRELLTLLPFTLIGLTLGVTLLVRLPRETTVLALGLFVCVYALHVTFRRGPARRLSRWWQPPPALSAASSERSSASAVRRTSSTLRPASPTRRPNARRSPRWSS